MKRTKASQKKIKMLFILIILLAILSITATYAWFSTQRDVEITGMRLNVEVAESMQISLDGQTWVQSIEIANMRQFYGTYGGTLADGSTPHQAVGDADGKGNANYVPTELLPVSTDGTVTDGILKFVQGTIIGKKLIDVAKCNEEDTVTTTKKISEKEAANALHPYLVFDMYLRNVSAKAEGQTDQLILNTGSHVWTSTTSRQDEGPSVQATGLEYSARVGFILYGNTYKITDGDTVDGEGNVTQTIGEKVRAIAPTGTEKVAIWEPNDLHHTVYVYNNDARIKALSPTAFPADGLFPSSYTTLPILNSVGGTVQADGSIADAGTVDDITDATDTDSLKTTGFAVMKPTYSLEETVDGDDTLPAGTRVQQNITHIDGTGLGLKANTMSKVRVYIWLEGQDPDCVDLASTGGKLDIDLKFTKGTTTVTKPTYTGTGVAAGGGG